MKDKAKGLAWLLVRFQQYWKVTTTIITTWNNQIDDQLLHSTHNVFHIPTERFSQTHSRVGTTTELVIRAQGECYLHSM